METFLSVCLGIGLSAACGFRIFIPLLVLSAAAHTGHVHLASGFQWIGSQPALIAFAVATALEVGGYYIPWVDHALDAIAGPVAVVAGMLVTASLVTDMSPMLKWTLAVIAGGGAAGLVQGGTMVLRGASTATTGGLGNPIFATAELAGAVVTSVLSLVAPVLVFLLLVVIAVIVARKVARKDKPPSVAIPRV
jgi:hypothetical protein